MHSLTWEEAQLLGGMDPDFHRRDLYDAIEAGAYPQWELGIQAFEDTPDQTFEGIDLLDPTKLVPEELAPVQPLGLLTLTGTPTNFFAEAEQVAFHVGNLVPGIDVTDDPLLQVRLFSYVDTQLTRLGGPNFNQLPINRPHAPVNDMLRDGMHQTAVHGGVAPYRPNSLDGGCPFVAGDAEGAFLDVPQAVAAGSKVRELSASFDDHFSQARLFWLSMSPGRAGPHRAGLHLRARQVLRRARSASASCSSLAQHRRRARRRRRGRARDAGARAGGRGRRRHAEPRAVAAGRHLADRGAHRRHRRRRDVRRGRRHDPHRAAARRSAWCRCCSPPRVARSGPTATCRRTAPCSPPGRWSSTPSSWPPLVPPAADARQSRDAKAGAGATPRSTRGSPCSSTRRSGTARASASSGDPRMAAALGLADDEAGVTVGDAAAVAAAVVDGLAEHRAWDRFTPSR